MRSNLVSPRTAPKTGEIHVLAFLARFGPQAAENFFFSTLDPQKPVNRELTTTQRCPIKKVADGVNRLGPKGSQLDDPNPNQEQRQAEQGVLLPEA